MEDFKKMFQQRSKHYSAKVDKSRQRFTVGNARGPALSEPSAPVSGYLTTESVLIFRDLGLQLGWRLVYAIEYAGPILFVPLFYHLPKLFYKTAFEKTPHQKLCAALLVGHFIKRELESLFVHRFSNATMPFKNLYTNCAYYWLLNGAFIGYFLLHPKYAVPRMTGLVKTLLLAGFAGSQILNFICHVILRNLRPPGTRARGIPKGWGFDQASCANYFWELCSWGFFAGLTRCIPSYIFFFATFSILLKWAKARHNSYVKEFDGKDGRLLYPRNRKAFIPYII